MEEISKNPNFIYEIHTHKQKTCHSVTLESYNLKFLLLFLFEINILCFRIVIVYNSTNNNEKQEKNDTTDRKTKNKRFEQMIEQNYD